MKNLIIDLDATLTIDEEQVAYKDKRPNLALIKKLENYKAQGFKIIIFTSRGMRSFKGDVAKIKEQNLPEILAWLEKHKVPFDEVILGKAWCGFEGFYVDDKALRPSEFISKTYEQIKELLEFEKKFNKTNLNEKSCSPKTLSQSSLNLNKNGAHSTNNASKGRKENKAQQVSKEPQKIIEQKENKKHKASTAKKGTK